MNISKSLNYLLILIGCTIAIYAQAEEEQNQFVLILGIVILMLGLYRIASAIPSKKTNQEEEVYDEEE